uniref:Uncharacterized protein n=1 Tax=Knipowitschia caucasica TaxID=637954 RepID=A0AAV2LYZ6_KNICA
MCRSQRPDHSPAIWKWSVSKSDGLINAKSPPLSPQTIELSESFQKRRPHVSPAKGQPALRLMPRPVKVTPPGAKYSLMTVC